MIEPLSLDEAYLDISENKTGLATATLVATTIRQQIRTELNLIASVGVAPNKFPTKIASDWKKPDGLFVLQPHDAQSFLQPLAVGRIPGVGKVTESRMKVVGITTISDLFNLDLTELEGHFGRYGMRLHQLARGIDHSPVVPNRASKSISAEDTFERDIPLADTEPMICRLAEKVWNASRGNARCAKTVVLKLKTKQFATITLTSRLIISESSSGTVTGLSPPMRTRFALAERYQ